MPIKSEKPSADRGKQGSKLGYSIEFGTRVRRHRPCKEVPTVVYILEEKFEEEGNGVHVIMQ